MFNPLKTIVGLAFVAIMVMGAGSASAQQVSGGNPYTSNASPTSSQPAASSYNWNKPSASTSTSDYEDSGLPNYRWDKTRDFMVSTQAGFDSRGYMLADPPLSYKTAFMIAQIEKRCEDDRQRISGQILETFKTAVKVGAWETVGTVIGTIIGYSPIGNLWSILKQVVAPTAGAAFGGGIATGQIETAELMSMFMYVCVSARVDQAKMTNRADMWTVFIQPTLRMSSTAAPRLRRGQPGMTRSDLDDQMNDTTLRHSTIVP